MEHTDNEFTAPEPAPIRRLRQLVTLLTLTLIVGMVVIVGLMIYRLGPGATPTLPDQIALPSGESLISYSRSPDWTVLITRDQSDVQRVHLVAPGQADIRQTVVVTVD